MTVSEYLQITYDYYHQQGIIFGVRDRVFCSDGFSISIQGSNVTYCQPQENRGDYTHLELGFPESAEPLISDWAEDKNDLTGTVYPFVPIGIIEEVIQKHGGIDLYRTFQNYTSLLRDLRLKDLGIE